RQCKLISTDVVALNGVLHTVDKTMLPANMDIIVTCEQKPDIKPQCDIAVRCIEACGLTDSLKQPGPTTFICPTDAAFQAVFIELNITLEVLLADIPRCKKIMQCHMIPQRKCKKEFDIDQPVTTVQGTTIKVNASYQVVDVRGRICNLTTPDVLNTNGVLHVCDKVILPQDA
ncbi:MAG TPA: fasciclin domain-containing protein, partial [Variovorax sp.]|nr:fasciclin domain-containing protein [Variovorax sp.]